ncbi:outer membrane protein [Mesorhizobium marinum]|uniref:Outer membrane protein n=1 Tax=Mesorhizobium marinum TaxID=3228790 RepID=A0ABV3R1U5_9HYPH
MKFTPLVIALSASLAFSASALAADMTGETAPYDWSGVYVGVHAGGAWARADDSADRVNLGGGAIGGYAGANWQVGKWVVGIEGDVNFTANDGAIYGIDIGTGWQGALRGRLGYAIDSLLVYGAGGLAVSEVSVDAAPIIDETETFAGWTVGAGVEYAFTQNWVTRLDYRYSDYGGSNFGFMGTTDVDVTEHAVRVGVGYKF